MKLRIFWDVVHYIPEDNSERLTTVSHKNSVTFARYATVTVAVPSAIHYPANYKIKYII
jgi:hypothetical protein